MISPREVQIGSVVSYQGQTRIVKSVSQYIMMEGVKEWIGGSMVDGEPITIEWIYRLGFLLETGNIFGNMKMTISFYGNYFKHLDSLLTYQFVHQLQLLHFSLTGEHLKIPKLK